MVLRARGCNYRHYAVTSSSRWFVISVVIAIFRRVSLKRKQREARRCDASCGQRAQTKQIRVNSVLVFYLITVGSHLNEWKKERNVASSGKVRARGQSRNDGLPLPLASFFSLLPLLYLFLPFPFAFLLSFFSFLFGFVQSQSNLLEITRPTSTIHSALADVRDAFVIRMRIVSVANAPPAHGRCSRFPRSQAPRSFFCSNVR